MNSGLVLHGVSVHYGATVILDRIGLSVPQGQFLALLGASGCGKSTLLRLLAGLLEPTHGELIWQGRPIRGTSLERGIVFQDYTLFPWLSMVDNVALAVGKARPQAGRAERHEAAAHHLKRVGLEDAIGKYPFELSGGMQQRGAIARALALGSPLLLMDEPFGALDPINRARLQDLLLGLWESAEPRTTIVFVTHDVDEALYLGERVVVLGSAPGRVAADLPVPLQCRRERHAPFEDGTLQGLRRHVTEQLHANASSPRLAA